MDGANHHVLKLFVDYFQPVVDGVKRSEARRNDRDFKVGDTLELREGQNESGEFVYTGRSVCCRICFIDDFGMQPGFVNLSINSVGLLRITAPGVDDDEYAYAQPDFTPNGDKYGDTYVTR